MDWKQLITELLALEGMTQTKLGEELGVSQSTVSDMLLVPKRSPNFDLGQRVVALHAKRCKAKRTKAVA